MKKIFPMKSLSNAQQLGPTEEEARLGNDRAISTTMATPTFSAPTPTVVEEDETDTASAASESAYSQSSYSVTASEYSASEYASDTYTDEEDEVSYGDCLSSGGDSCNSLDSVERVLIRLEDLDPDLNEITLNCKSVDQDSANHIANLLPLNSHLQKITLSCGNSHKQAHKLQKIMSGLNDNKSIKYVEIRGMEINREVASQALIPPLTKNKSIKHLSFVDCNFVGAGIAILCIALQHNKFIRNLYFDNCDWDSHNTDTIGASLAFLNLHSLSLVGINIDDNSWQYLFKQIEELKDLVQLDLSDNELDANNTYLLIKSLKAHKKVSTLVLRSCELDERCMKELAKGLRTYSTLTNLDISQNKQMATVYLKDLLKFNKSIVQMKVDGCGLSKKSMEAVEEGLRYNNSFYKSFFSETTTKTIFGVMDSIEKIDTKTVQDSIVGAVSFVTSDSSPRNTTTERSPRTKKMANSNGKPSSPANSSANRPPPNRPLPNRPLPNRPPPRRPPPRRPKGPRQRKAWPQLQKQTSPPQQGSAVGNTTAETDDFHTVPGRRMLM